MGKDCLEYKNVPGRGLMSEQAVRQRIDFFRTLVKNSEVITSSGLSFEEVQNNIESFVGSVELPLGLVGPLLFDLAGEAEWVYSGICTTEGALVASMNRGARAISESGGFMSHFSHQKMLRAPLFVLGDMRLAVVFEEWLRNNFEKIKSIAGCFSNHAELIEIKPFVIGKLVHLKFIYTTSDASGQNMVTYCTWNSCQWIIEHFQDEKKIAIVDFYIDGNGSSDKKVSFYSLQNGRGIHVISECFLNNRIIEKTLRSNAADMFRLYNHSMSISRFDGMIGGTLNIANAIAGIFAATGQDLGSIHESSVGVLQIDKTDDGLYASLSIPALVIGTVGGGTHLPAARVILELMKCYGKGKVERFAKLISGFSLSLELSTLAALASGQFARAHQKMGKNKTINWLLKSEIDVSFLKGSLKNANRHEISSVELMSPDHYCNGILTYLASRVSKKIIGLFPLQVSYGTGQPEKIMMKSKPLDDELMNGLHFLASSINTSMADTLLRYKDHLEYNNSHLKEQDIYKFLKKINFDYVPEFYGEIRNPEREIFLFLFEYLDNGTMKLINSENEPDKWSDESIIAAFQAIHKAHKAFVNGNADSSLGYITEFDPTSAILLYEQCNQVNRNDFAEWSMDPIFEELLSVINSWKNNPPLKKSVRTLVHNDFNPRNVGLRTNGKICIYDWELAMRNIPQRDIFEFLAFTMKPDFTKEQIFNLLKVHFTLSNELNGSKYSWNDYLDDFIISGYEYLITRASFYLAGSNFVDYRFIKRVILCSHRIIQVSRDFYERI